MKVKATKLRVCYNTNSNSNNYVDVEARITLDKDSPTIIIPNEFEMEVDIKNELDGFSTTALKNEIAKREKDIFIPIITCGDCRSPLRPNEVAYYNSETKKGLCPHCFSVFRLTKDYYKTLGIRNYK